MTDDLSYKQGYEAGSRSGFTFVELAVAVLVFCLGFVGITKMQNMAIRGNAYSMQLTEATNVTKSTAERLMGLPQDSDSMGGAGPLTEDSTFSSPSIRSKTQTYKPSWSVSEVPATSLRQVTVTVRWNDSGAAHSVAVVFFK
jgi:Tfp pilus assembly protein PilV